ncbi:hypothetical protein [Ornithinibacillus gellani]|nr:hypothetical protein [Ornithinibacillus gellani]
MKSYKHLQVTVERKLGRKLLEKEVAFLQWLFHSHVKESKEQSH